MASALKSEHLPHYTYEDYLCWEGNWELICGIPYAMNPTPTYYHQSINPNILYELKDKLKNCKNCRASMPVDWKINSDTVVQPDVSVICGKITGKWIDITPSMIFEILSPASKIKDRELKYEIYLEQRVKYYIVVDPDTHSVEVFELNGDKYLKSLETKEDNFTFNIDTCVVNFDFGKIWSEE